MLHSDIFGFFYLLLFEICMRFHAPLHSLFFVLLLLSNIAYSESLIDIFKAVQENDPAWKTSEYAYQSGKQTKGIGRAYILPNLTVSGEHKSVIDDPTDCQVGADCSEDEYDSTTYQVQLVQPLLNVEGWRIYKEARAGTENAEIQYQSAFQNNIYDTAVLYFDVLRAQETYSLALSEHNALAVQLKEIQAKAEAGVSDQTEVIETQASHDLALVSRITELGYLKVAFEDLITHSGIEKPSIMALSPDYPIQQLVPFDEQLWVNKAKKNSLNIKAMQQSVELAERSYRTNTANIYPKIDLFASYSDREQDGGRFVQNGSSEAIGVRVSMPIFVGLGDFYTAKEQKMKYLQTSEDVEAQKREFLQIVKNRFRSIYTDVLTAEARKKSLSSSEQALKAVKAQYDLGSRDMADVLNAQKQLFAAKREYANARYNYLLDLMQLKLFVGELSVSDLEEVNSWLILDESLMTLDTIP